MNFHRSLLLTLFCFPFLSAQTTIVEDSVLSRSLNSYSRYLVLLPAGYDKSQERYPVLYLLHGLGGDHTNWVKLTGLTSYAASYRMIIVTPDAKDGWYSNSAFLKDANYEDHIINDVIPDAEKKYRTIQTKFQRGIAGLSMGGYGAIKYALRYPGKFGFAAGLSPSIQFPAALEDSAIVKRWSRPSIKDLRALFGTTRNDSWKQNDLFAIAENANASAVPYLYLSFGSQDGILEIPGLTHDLAALLRKKGIAFEMHEYPGDHNWKFWDREIRTVLSLFNERMMP